MKRTCVLFATLALIFILPATAYAAGASLAIDNVNVYKDMNKSYEDGYSPAVKEGKATIILPLVAVPGGAIQGDIITATPGLGDPSSSPFKYNNYQKTVSLEPNEVTQKDGSIAVRSSYLVVFDLELSPNRVNGVYPVTIEITATATDGTPVQQSFTTYVTVDGKNPNSNEPTKKPVSQPKIIVSGYSMNPSPAMTGNDFTATITLRNTSEKQSVQNMSVTVSCDSSNFVLQNESNVIYIGKLAKGAETDIEVTYKTDLDTQPQRYNITLNIEYDNSDAQTLSSSGTIPVEISQPLRVEMETPKIPESVNAGDTMPLSFQIMNMGRGKVYNVRIKLSAPGLIPAETEFIGNMEPGTAMPGEMDVFVGTKNMTEGYEGNDKYGYTSGKITLIYEDEKGQEYTNDTEFSTTINPPVISPASAEPAEEPEKAGQWWISVLIGAVAIAGLATFLIIRGRKGRQHEDF